MPTGIAFGAGAPGSASTNESGGHRALMQQHCSGNCDDQRQPDLQFDAASRYAMIYQNDISRQKDTDRYVYGWPRSRAGVEHPRF